MHRTFQAIVSLLAACMLSAGLLAQVNVVTAAASSRHAAEVSTAPSDGLTDPAGLLAAGWQHSSDKMVMVQGDGSGLHVLVADEARSYQWQTVATLGDPGVQTSLWIGQACVSADGRFAAVVYAPREVTNMAGAMGVLGRAAVVNLGTGAVREVGGGYSMAYFDPGCGTGDEAVLTRGGWGGNTPTLPAVTQLELLNMTAGTTTAPVTVPGQVTSAIPYAGAIAAAYGRGISEISPDGKVRTLTVTTSVPFRLVPDSHQGLGFETLAGQRVRLHRFAAGRTELVGSAPLGSVQLSGQGGRIWLTGSTGAALRLLPAGWRAEPVPAGSLMSSAGALAVTSVGAMLPRSAGLQPGESRPVTVQGQLLTGSRKPVTFTVPAAASAALMPDNVTARPGPERSSPAGGSPSTPVSADRTCGPAVNDPSVQAYQPDFSQVEWAADQAVTGHLRNTRPAGLYGSRLPAYTPQGLFPLGSLAGGGSIPAQVLLGVLTQESNLEQASVHVDQGQASNPLTSYNWYGTWNGATNTGNINWANADCGYGIGQITTGMCIAKHANNDPQCQYTTPLNTTRQLAVAVDYQANIAAAAQILSNIWNQLRADKITMNSAVPDSANYIENWYMALWAYNSGLEPGSAKYGNTTGCIPSPTCTDGNHDWGLGFANNPANPAYPPDRPIFPETSSARAPGGGTYSPTWDMSHPQYWAYQEKVISWAFDSVTLYDYNLGKDVQAFAYAHGNSDSPPKTGFCASADHCDPSVINPASATAPDPCQLTGTYKDHCWWHLPATWKGDCTTPQQGCGTTVPTYKPGAPAPPNPKIAQGFLQDCTRGGLPSNAVIVGADKPALGCPGQNWTSAGPMTWNFAKAPNGTYPSKINIDQIGSGLGGHFWFSYTIPNAAYDPALGNPPLTTTLPEPAHADDRITGTWPAPSRVKGWTEIYAHIPVYGAWDPEANYQINPGDGQSAQHRIVNQAWRENTWVPLGLFDLGSGASVSLSNVTYKGYGRDIAWNGLAFVPSKAPRYSYVALGDSYSSGQGLTPYQPNSNYNYKGMISSCNRSQTQAYPDLITVPGTSTRISQEAAASGSGAQFAFLACSGQFTTQVTESAADRVSAPAYGQVQQNPMQNVPAFDTLDLGYGEVPQADQGYLNQMTNLVTMTVGGDDARFAGVLSSCITSQTILGSCDVTLQGDPSPLNVYEPKVLKALSLHLEQDYATVAADARHAKIIVIAYPNLFTGDQSSDGCGALPAPVSPGLARWLNLMGDDLRTATEIAVAHAVQQKIDITLINSDPVFEGHESCDSNNWINFESSGGGSFHPNPAGHQAFADLVDECLVGRFPQGQPSVLVQGDGTCP